MSSRAFPCSPKLRAAARRVRGLALIVAASALTACGGYGGGSSSYSSPSSSPPAMGTAAPPASGTSSGSGTNTAPPAGPAMAAAGPITGFGTVHLNGLVFETTSATITIDGNAATQDDLRAGEF